MVGAGMAPRFTTTGGSCFRLACFYVLRLFKLLCGCLELLMLYCFSILMLFLELMAASRPEMTSSSPAPSSPDSFSKLEMLEPTRLDKTDYRGISFVRPSSSSRSSAEMFDCWAGMMSSAPLGSVPMASATFMFLIPRLTLRDPWCPTAKGRIDTCYFVF